MDHDVEALATAARAGYPWALDMMRRELYIARGVARGYRYGMFFGWMHPGGSVRNEIPWLDEPPSEAPPWEQT